MGTLVLVEKLGGRSRVIRVLTLLHYIATKV